MNLAELQDIEIRPAVMHFAAAMERVLRTNDHKGGWLEMTDKEIVSRIGQEVREIDFPVLDYLRVESLTTDFHSARMSEEMKSALKTHQAEALSKLFREAVDVAAFAMMLIDPERKGQHANEPD